VSAPKNPNVTASGFGSGHDQRGAASAAYGENSDYRNACVALIDDCTLKSLMAKIDVSRQSGVFRAVAVLSDA
jgi:hypothetical protein